MFSQIYFWAAYKFGRPLSMKCPNSDRAPLEQIFKSEYSKDDRMKKKDTDCLRIGDLVVARYIIKGYGIL